MKRILAAAVALSALAAGTQAQAADFILTSDGIIDISNASHFYITLATPTTTSATLTNTAVGGFTDNYYFAPLIASIGSGSAVTNTFTGLTFATPGLSISAYTLTAAAGAALSSAFTTASIATYNANVATVIGEATSALFTIDGTAPDALSRQLTGVPLDPTQFYKISISGTGTASGSVYSGNLTSTTVPEPATWAMMLLGFGAVGFAMRSRRKEQPKVRFAF